MSNSFERSLSFEQGPIRPPSEARSLLIRFTRNCSWNKCKFCPVYKNDIFERRSLEEIKSDIDTIAKMLEQIINVSKQIGEGGIINDIVISHLLKTFKVTDSFYNVIMWSFYKTGSVFIQDANNLVIKCDFFVEALRYLYKKIPGIKKVTTYARSGSAARYSLEDLCKLKEAGLTRVHIGLETGYDPLLKFVKKGVSAAIQIEGGIKIKKAGIELSEYVMPGLGGQKWWKEHAVETAKVLNMINPDFIRLRTLRVLKGTELDFEVKNGNFEKLEEDLVIKEIELFVKSLKGIDSYLVSDHMMNLIETVEGKLPKEKGKILAVLNKYLRMSDSDRFIYRLCRRIGQCSDPEDIYDPVLRERLETLFSRLKEDNEVTSLFNEWYEKGI